MQLNSAEISDLIKKRIESYQIVTEARTEGTVVSVTDGIVRIHGLSAVMYGEMIEFPGNTYGLGLKLECVWVGAVVLVAYELISVCDALNCSGRNLEVRGGCGVLG